VNVALAAAREGLSTERPSAPGWVYCMSVPGSRALKLGMTARTPSARAADMHYTIGPSRLRVEAAWLCTSAADARRLERACHQRLSTCRVNGSEWFAGETLAGIEDVVDRVAASLGIAIEFHDGAALTR